MARGVALFMLVSLFSACSSSPGPGDGGTSGGATAGGSSGGGGASGGSGGGTGGGTTAPGPFTSQGASSYETQTAVAANDQGVVVAAWIAFFANNTSSIGYSVSHDSGATWTAPAIIASPGGRLASNPVLVADSQGRFTLAWLGFRAASPSDEHVYVSRLGAGDIFGTPVTASDDGTSSTLDFDKPSLAVDSADQLLLTFADFTTNGMAKLMFARSVDGVAFTRTTVVSDMTFGNLASLCFDRALGANAPLYMVHLGANGTLTLRVSTNLGMNWQLSTVAVPASAVVFQDPTCVVNGTNIWIAYASGTASFSPTTESPGEAVQVVHTGNAGMSFDAPVTASSAPAATRYLSPRIARTSTGKLVLSWYQGVPGAAATMQLAGSTNGTAFTAAQVAPAGTLTLDRTLANWLGGYTGLAIQGSQALLTYAENSNARAHIAFSKVTPP